MPASHRFDKERERLEQEAVTWMVRLHSGEAAESDRQALDKWRSRSDAHDRAFLKVGRLWRGLQLLRHQLPLSPEQTVEASRAVDPAKEQTHRHRWIALGALAASIAALAVMLTLISGVLPFLQADARTGTGERLTVPLDDGSWIHLNTRAAISIHYSNDVRRIDLLTGEAAFYVAKDAARPFIVYSRRGHVRAVGTEFIVRESDEAVTVTVTEGVVEVRASELRDDVPALVQAGRRVAYGPSGMGRVEPADLRVATAWQRGKLIFEAAPLSVVIDEINRYRPGRVVLMNESLARRPVSGVFDPDRLDAALSTIEQTLPVTTYRVLDRFVVFR